MTATFAEIIDQLHARADAATRANDKLSAAVLSFNNADNDDQRQAALAEMESAQADMVFVPVGGE